MVRTSNAIARFAASPFCMFADDAPWVATGAAEQRVRDLQASAGDDYRRIGDASAHVSAKVEPGARFNGPVLIGPDCFVAEGVLLRAGVWLEAGCVIGPGCEIRSSLLFRNARLAHFNFVGDSLIGEDVNLEAGAVIANRRNEWDPPCIRVRAGADLVEIPAERFGALVGDGARIGANAVLAPGTILPRGARVERLALVDQARDASG